jgi:hypothetical protein
MQGYPTGIHCNSVEKKIRLYLGQIHHTGANDESFIDSHNFRKIGMSYKALRAGLEKVH